MGSESTRYWSDALRAPEVLLQEEEQMRANGTGDEFPADLKAETLAVSGILAVRSQQWQKALDISKKEIALAEEMHGSSTALRDVKRPGGKTTFHGENLGKAFVRYSIAASQIPASRAVNLTARRGCDRASRITSGLARQRSLECRKEWEYEEGDLVQSMLTAHEVYGLQLPISHSAWVAVTAVWGLLLILLPLTKSYLQTAG